MIQIRLQSEQLQFNVDNKGWSTIPNGNATVTFTADGSKVMFKGVANYFYFFGNETYRPTSDIVDADNSNQPFNQTTLEAYLIANNFFKRSTTSGGGGGGDVTSVFNRTGDVVATSTDYAAFYMQKDATELNSDYYDFNSLNWNSLANGFYYISTIGANLVNAPFATEPAAIYTALFEVVNNAGVWGQQMTLTSDGDWSNLNKFYLRTAPDFTSALTLGWTNLTPDNYDDERTTWLLSTDVVSALSIAYASASVEINSSGNIPLYILSGTTPAQSFRVSSGTLPSEFSLDTTTGALTYTTTSTVKSGSFGVTATNPVGDSDEFIVNYEISAPNGVAQFSNSESPYPFLRITTSKSIATQVLIKSQFYGRTTSTSNGTIIEDSAYPIYWASNGDGTWNYFIFPTGYSYWNLYKNSTTDPSTLADGLSTDLSTGSLDYDLVAPTSDNVTLNGVNYPSDRSDIHWGTGQNYFSAGVDASLDNFLTDAGSWTYGFRLQEPWLPDGLGRTCFNREGRNWHGVAYGHNGTYSEMIYGNGSNTSYDSSEVVTLPANGFSIGDFVKFTFDGSILRFYVNGTLYYDYSVTSYMDGSSANVLPIQFGNSADANIYQTSTSYYHGNWQGLIDRLWVANGVVESNEDDGTTYPPGTTHAWDLDETTGSTFSAAIGTVQLTGESAS